MEQPGTAKVQIRTFACRAMVRDIGKINPTVVQKGVKQQEGVGCSRLHWLPHDRVG
jgi:hypothetical protein